MPKPAQYAESGTVRLAKAKLARVRRFASTGHYAPGRDVIDGRKDCGSLGSNDGNVQGYRRKNGEKEFPLALSSRRLRSLVSASELLEQLRPIVKRQRTAEVRHARHKRDQSAKHALPWAKQQKPAKSTPPRPFIIKEWCQACDRYHELGKHGPGRAK
jgi:hypothetical protein